MRVCLSASIVVLQEGPVCLTTCVLLLEDGLKTCSCSLPLSACPHNGEKLPKHPEKGASLKKSE